MVYFAQIILVLWCFVRLLAHKLIVALKIYGIRWSASTTIMNSITSSLTFKLQYMFYHISHVLSGIWFAIWVRVGIADFAKATVLVVTGLNLVLFLLVWIWTSSWLQNQFLNLGWFTDFLTNLFTILLRICCMFLSLESARTCSNEI